MTKIDIVSGFLGAGKTTLIKKLIREAYAGEQLVLIENEFGEIGIDGGFLQDAGIQITEMNAGCICCSLVGDFTKAPVSYTHLGTSKWRFGGCAVPKGELSWHRPGEQPLKNIGTAALPQRQRPV